MKINKPKNKGVKLFAVIASDSKTTRLSHIVKKAQATGMRALVCGLSCPG
jgi:hypothetical protein